MSEQLLISAIMPVYGQKELAEIALASFFSQDWARKELIVIDDSPEPVFQFDQFRGHPEINVQVVRLPEREKIGPKRNMACAFANGEIIVHFDSDDWSAPNRISDQVTRLVESGKAVSGYHSMLFWDGERNEAFQYQGTEDYSLGSGLCYRKEFWRKHSFVAEDQRRWEDNVFVQAARNDGEIVAVDAEKRMVARIHSGNTCPKKPRENPRQWSLVDGGEIPQEFFECTRKAVSLAL